MTVEEVHRQFPSARRPSKIDSLQSGATKELELLGVDIGSTKATAEFFFLNGGLAQVTLSAEGLSENATISNLTLAKEISYSLDSKYGSGRCENKNIGVMTQYECDWRVGDVNIGLLYLDIDGKLPLLNVVYQTRLAPAKTNL